MADKTDKEFRMARHRQNIRWLAQFRPSQASARPAALPSWVFGIDRELDLKVTCLQEQYESIIELARRRLEK